MKLSGHVDSIRQLITRSLGNNLDRIGIAESGIKSPESLSTDETVLRNKILAIVENFTGETGTYQSAREKALDELTFTLFNRLAAVKVMEAHVLFPEIITKRAENGGRSFSHRAWLEQNPEKRDNELEGLKVFIQEEFKKLSTEINLFDSDYPFDMLPTSVDLNIIIDAFNAIEKDEDVGIDIWKSDDILGWLYESYNNYKKEAHKDSGDKTEFNKVAIQSQVYTPRWVVKFLIDNSLGKLYLEMYPDSDIKNKYKIANVPKTRVREPKPLTEIKMIDPACGSGNFLLYAFDLFHDLYRDQIENFGVNYDEERLAQLIIENNIHGIDIDDRAIQLAQLGLYIKAKRYKRSSHIDHFNVISTDFYLPSFAEALPFFDSDGMPDEAVLTLLKEEWEDLQQAHKFGSLLKPEDKFNKRIEKLRAKMLSKHKQGDLFIYGEAKSLDDYREKIFPMIERAFAKGYYGGEKSFLKSKTADSIRYLSIISRKYDVAAANPPYTDSADFGPELKKFIESNFKTPFKFNANLYVAFIRRCFELVNENGKIGMIHPRTFMYIKSFEDVRKFILEKTHINLLAELESGGVFELSNVAIDAVMYNIEKEISNTDGIYFDLKIYHNYTNKGKIFNEIYNNFMDSHKDKHVYILNQTKLKLIKSYPFIYWISDGFRDKFANETFKNYFNISEGLKTGNNIKYFRFNWEFDSKKNNQEIVPIFKGGPHCKWYGTIWLVIDYKNKTSSIESENSYSFSGLDNYFNLGITCPSVGSGGPSFKLKNNDVMFSNADLGIFNNEKNEINNYYTLACLNSKLVSYINSMLNPTVNITVGDIQRIPFVQPNKSQEKNISEIVYSCVEIKKQLCSFSIIELNFSHNPIIWAKLYNSDIPGILMHYLNYENALLTLVLLNEAIINEVIFNIYDLSFEDKKMVLEKEGNPVGNLPVSAEAKEAYLKELINLPYDGGRDEVIKLIKDLPIIELSNENKNTIIANLTTLYQSNNDIEEFCMKNNSNPIEVWFLFKENKIIPEQRAKDIALELLTDIIREILIEDDDGIIPLVRLAGEEILIDRIERKFNDKGFSTAQYAQFASLLGRDLQTYLQTGFFKDLSDHLNLFMYLPKTPFIWHLTSGPYHGFDAYILIYKWSRDNLFKIKSQYLQNREQSLMNRQTDLANDNSAKAQSEKETISYQLREIEQFRKKIDELLTEGYNPILDDGVGKNIAPLQKKGMISYEVLKPNQLQVYLNADW